MNEPITREDLKYYVDWDSLKYYDKRIKDYIQLTSATIADQDQLKVDIDQLEERLAIVSENFTIDKRHIYDHIEACRLKSATKDELTELAAQLREEIKGATGVDLTAYATKEFVEERLANIGGGVELPDNLVTKEDLSAVEAKIPSVEGLASETYVDEKVASIVVPEVPTKVSELENDAGFVTLEDIPEIPTNISTFTNDAGYLTGVPEEYITDAELESKGYLTEIPDEVVTEDELEERVGAFQSTTAEKLTTLETNVTNLTETNETLQTTVNSVQQNVAEVSTQVTNLEQNIQNNYITVDDGVTKDTLVETVRTQVETEVETIVDEKIAEAITGGASVSSIAYGEF